MITYSIIKELYMNFNVDLHKRIYITLLGLNNYASVEKG